MNIFDYSDKLKDKVGAFVDYWKDMSEDYPSNYPYEMDEVDWDEQFFAFVNRDLTYNDEWKYD
jgi:hypothetical protein